MTEANESNYRKRLNIKSLFFVSFIFFLLIFPGVFYKIFTGDPITAILRHAGICLLFLLIPLVLFYWNIKVYLYILAIFALFVPMICFSIYFFGLHDMSIITMLVFQTNLHEAVELGNKMGIPFLLITFLYIILYLFCVRSVSIRKVPFAIVLIISIFSSIVAWKKMSAKAKDLEEPYVMVLDQYYPASLVSSIANIYSDPFETKVVHHFSFHAYKKDSTDKKLVYLFIIGESSNYYHWQIYGYPRPTSPKLLDLKNLIRFPNVVAGAHYTALSVPQMITRATPEHMQVQYKEKSILSAFKEAGFKTIWLSNQYPNYWISTIVPHAVTADVCIFPDSKLLDPSNPYDSRFFPLLDSIISHTHQNLFIVFHTMGSHWDYAKRYPVSFDYFRPSGTDISIDWDAKNQYQAIINSYDNSIRYSDFIIDSVIQIIKKYKTISYVSFLADHGEDVFDSDKKQWYSHDKASKYTLHVPLFIWTSDQYNMEYRQKRIALEANKDKPIGEDDIFYTLLNMANITYPGFDSTKSIASNSFINNPQEYMEPNNNKILLYSNLHK